MRHSRPLTKPCPSFGRAARFRTPARHINYANAQKPHLLGLPLELLLEVVQYLSLASTRALAFTCQKLYHASSLWIKDNVLWNKYDRFEILCYLEKDHLIPTFVCRGCATDHEADMFPPGALSMQPVSRWCFVSLPVFPLCPDHAISFRDAQKQNKVLRLESPYAEQGWVSSDVCCTTVLEDSNITTDHYLIASKEVESLCVLTIFHVFDIENFEKLPSVSEVKDLLVNHYDSDICPHIRLNDPRIIDAYDPSSVQVLEPADAADPSSEFLKDKTIVCPNPHCGTTFRWSCIRDYIPQEDRAGLLQLLVLRSLGALKDHKDPRWVVHGPFSHSLHEDAMAID